MPTITIAVEQVVTAGQVDVDCISAVTSFTGTARGRMPAIFPADQAFYWTKVWQERETVAVAELAAGQGQRYASAQDAIRSLLRADRD